MAYNANTGDMEYFARYINQSFYRHIWCAMTYWAIYNYQHFGIFGACLKMGGRPKFFFPWKHDDQPLNLRPHNFQTSSPGDSTTPQKSHGCHFLKLQFRGSNFLANPCGSSKLVCSSPLLVDSTVKPGSLHFLATSLKTGNLNDLNMHWQKQVFVRRGMVIFWKFMVLIPTGLTMIQLDPSHLNRFNFAFKVAKLPVAGFQSLGLGLHHGCQP